MSNKLITVTQVVEQYGVSRKTIQRWIAAGKIEPDQTLPGRTGAHLFYPETVEAAIKDRHADPEEAAVAASEK